MTTISLAIIVADPVFRRGLRMLIHDIPRVELVASSFETHGFLNSETTPDIILIDTGTRFFEGLSKVNEIMEHFPLSSVILLTDYNQHTCNRLSRENGIQGLIIKPFSGKTLSDTIDAVAKGKTSFPNLQ